MSNVKKFKKYTRRHLNWRVDYDYLKQLSEEEKAWLDKFTDEYYRSTFKDLESVHDLGKSVEYELKFSKKKKGTRKQQLIYEDYVRRRDILYNKSGLLYNGDASYTPEMYSETAVGSPEDAIIDYIDSKNNAKVSIEGDDKSHK